MELQIFSIDEEAGKIEVSLTKKEALYFADKPKKKKKIILCGNSLTSFKCLTVDLKENASDK
ncbi:hypothetical protein BF90_3062 [Bacillus anthracis]|nr:hypothetical protein BF90_3062 [Bacillus anthracis]